MVGYLEECEHGPTLLLHALCLLCWNSNMHAALLVCLDVEVLGAATSIFHAYLHKALDDLA